MFPVFKGRKSVAPYDIEHFVLNLFVNLGISDHSQKESLHHNSSLKQINILAGLPYIPILVIPYQMQLERQEFEVEVTLMWGVKGTYLRT